MTRYETKRYLLSALIVVFVLFGVSYGFFQARNLLRGPMLSLSGPANGSLLSASLAVIAGRAENAQKVMVNDRIIDVDESGNFSESLLMAYGYNIVTVKAYDRFGRETEETLQLVYK
jgi:hypothetical protein